MQSFWVWISLLAAVWLAAWMNSAGAWTALQLIGCALFLLLFFLAPLFRSNQWVFSVILVKGMAVTAAVFWAEMTAAPIQWYVFLIFTIVAGKAVYRLNGLWAAVVGSAAVIIAVIPHLINGSLGSMLLIMLYAVTLALASVVYVNMRDRLQDVGARQDALLSEYRQLKRYRSLDEDMARQQERARIAENMHDSVGHKLTALLLQLEVFRLQSEGETALLAERLKSIAQDSLDETRKAVRALHQEETGGISAIQNMIRKLEAESLIRVNFSMGQGVLSSVLTPEQSVIVYRTVQEALTNALRHGSSRMIDINLEAPAGRVFRFVISNPRTGSEGIQEGFGLSRMKERLGKINGSLSIVEAERRFIVEGTFPLKGEEDKHDSNTTG